MSLIWEVTWDTLKVVAIVLLVGALLYKLVVKIDAFTPMERWGMGLIAAGAIMVIGPITFKPSPFDDWAMTLMLIGNAIYFIGREFRHRYANWEATRRARQILQDRGLL